MTTTPTSPRRCCAGRASRRAGRGRAAGGTGSGDVLALGWWVNPDAGAGGDSPVGTLSLVADTSLPRPVWIARDDPTGFRLEG